MTKISFDTALSSRLKLFVNWTNTLNLKKWSFGRYDPNSGVNYWYFKIYFLRLFNLCSHLQIRKIRNFKWDFPLIEKKGQNISLRFQRYVVVRRLKFENTFSWEGFIIKMMFMLEVGYQKYFIICMNNDHPRLLLALWAEKQNTLFRCIILDDYLILSRINSF